MRTNIDLKEQAGGTSCRIPGCILEARYCRHASAGHRRLGRRRVCAFARKFTQLLGAEPGMKMLVGVMSARSLQAGVSTA